jgi:hypothetical protein
MAAESNAGHRNSGHCDGSPTGDQALPRSSHSTSALDEVFGWNVELEIGHERFEFVVQDFVGLHEMSSKARSRVGG